MKPFKRLACLVTLQFIGCLALTAAEPGELRQWTDPSGRTINARLVEIVGANSIKIEREDGQVFTVALKLFSAEDQSYVKSVGDLDKASKTAGSPGFKAADAALWALLDSAGTQPASTYSNTGLDLVLESINQRFSVRDVKTSAGRPLQVRTEPSDLASRVKISGDMPRMSLASFMKEIARANNLAVATDPTGMVVLVDKTPASDQNAPDFLGVKLSQR